MTEFDLERSELVSIIRAHIDRPSVDPRPAEPRTIFLPWFSPNERESRENLQRLAGVLGLPLLILPAHYSVTHDARLLRELAPMLCGPDRGADLSDTLRTLRYTAGVEDAALDRIRDKVDERRRRREPVRLAIAALKAGPEADSSVSRMLDWTSGLNLDSVLVLAHRRPPGLVETIDLPVPRLRKDVIKLAPVPPDVSRYTTPSFYSRLWRYLRSTTADRSGATPEQLAIWQEDLNQIETGDQAPADWADLLTRLVATNWGAASTIVKAWEALDGLIERYLRHLENKPGSTSGSVTRAPSNLDPDNVEERETLENRLRFVEMLRILYPEVFEAAAHELDGADQLYRTHLILCGQTASDGLVSNNLMPFWQQHLDDPLFRELFYSCFNAIGRERPLVARMESREQLHRLLLWVEKRGGFEDENDTPLQRLLQEHLGWLRHLAADPVELRAAEAPLAGWIQTATEIIDANPTASEALRAAQTLMSAYELLEKPGLARALYRNIERLARRAINQSRAAIRFDATLLRARALAVAGGTDPALEILRNMRRTVREQLSRCAVDIEEAFVHERAEDFFRATNLYQSCLVMAERLGADELVARAASGCLRCDAAAYRKDPKRSLQVRASITVRIHSARAPELFPMSKRSKPRLFISYRKETGLLTKRLVHEFQQDKSLLNTWADVLLAEGEDFNPRIHQLLHDSDAIVLLLSPKYFESPWCVHELHFALGQNDDRGVPLYWVWCSNRPSAGVPCERAARAEFEGYLQQVYGDSRPGSQVPPPTEGSSANQQLRYQRAHVEERLTRLFSCGRLIINEPLPFDDAGAPAAVGRLVERLNRTARYLYSRAKLPFPSSLTDEDEP